MDLQAALARLAQPVTRPSVSTLPSVSGADRWRGAEPDGRPRPELVALRTAVEHLHAVTAALLAAVQVATTPDPPRSSDALAISPDRWLTVQQAAVLVGERPYWVRRNAHRLTYARWTGKHRVVFDRLKLEAVLRGELPQFLDEEKPR